MMETFKTQIGQATEVFLGQILELARTATESMLSSAFASGPGVSSPRLKRPDAGGVGADGRSAKRSPDELGHLSRRFAEFVREHPGLRIEQINRQLGTTTAALMLPIRKLVAEGSIATQGRKRSTTYHPGDARSGRAAGDSESTPPPASVPRDRRVKSKSRSRLIAAGGDVRSARAGVKVKATSRAKSRSRSKSKSRPGAAEGSRPAAGE